MELAKEHKQAQSPSVVNHAGNQTSEVSWHNDSQPQTVSLDEFPDENSSSAVIGRWGEGVARCHLARAGIYVVRHAVFRMPQRRVIVDFYDPSTLTICEVKTRARPNSPFIRVQIGKYRSLVERGMAKRAVFINVAFRGSMGFSASLRNDILAAGFGIMYIGESTMG